LLYAAVASDSLFAYGADLLQSTMGIDVRHMAREDQTTAAAVEGKAKGKGKRARG